MYIIICKQFVNGLQSCIAVLPLSSHMSFKWLLYLNSQRMVHCLFSKLSILCVCVCVCVCVCMRAYCFEEVVVWLEHCLLALLQSLGSYVIPKSVKTHSRCLQQKKEITDPTYCTHVNKYYNLCGTLH